MTVSAAPLTERPSGAQPTGIAALAAKEIEVPALPTIAAKALSAINDPDTSAAQLGSIFSLDQGLTTKILKVANSALYGLMREVKSVQQATTVIGRRGLKGIVVSVACRTVYGRFGKVDELRWQHALGAGIAAQVLAEKLKSFDRDDAFIAGLTHDVGKVVMNGHDPARFAEMTRLCSDGGAGDLEAEQRVFSFNHADVGALLAQKWKLPESLEQASLLHHDFELAESLAPGCTSLVWAIAAADSICDHLGLGAPKPADPAPLEDDPAIGLLGLESEDIQAIIAEVEKRFSESKALFA